MKEPHGNGSLKAKDVEKLRERLIRALAQNGGRASFSRLEKNHGFRCNVFDRCRLLVAYDDLEIVESRPPRGGKASSMFIWHGYKEPEAVSQENAAKFLNSMTPEQYEQWLNSIDRTRSLRLEHARRRERVRYARGGV